MWTNEQLLAINKRDSNILVSAGAGSGKTAVLTERITSIINEGHSIMSLLVLTFTNAAAEEMRERVRKKLSESDNPKFKEALNYVDSAKITTFDGYSLYLVKKYYYALGISKDIKIANSYYLSVKENEIIDDILSKYYDSEDKDLITYFNNFKAKDDGGLKRVIKNIYNKLLLKLNFSKYLDNYNDFYNDSNVNYLINEYVSLIKDNLLTLKGDYYNLIEVLPDGNDKAEETIRNLISKIDEIESYEDCLKFNEINSFKLQKSSDECKTVQKDITKSKDKIKKLLVFESTDEMRENILSTKSYSDLFIKIIRELDAKLMEFKKNNNYYDFIDIAKMAIRLVSENSEIREEIKNEFYEILIDEYQDTSDIQEAFISMISKDNVYMVGDVKQSIYRFRNANPYIFKDKYDVYKNGIGGIKIDLNKNFRSRSEVLNNINLIFNDAMTDEIGDANYKLEHQMNYGFTDYDKYLNDDYKYNMEINIYDREKKDPYKPAEYEAFFIAKDIKKLIDSKIKIYDKEEKIFREIKYQDICIIMDRGNNFSLYKKIFEYFGIPCQINADSQIKDSKIMPIISNLVNLVISEKLNRYDEKYYHSFYSIARSFLFELSDDEIFSLVMDAKNNKRRIDNEISNIAKEIADEEFDSSPKNTYLKIISSYKVEEKLYKIGDVKESLIVLEYIMDFIDNISSLGESLVEINEYLIDLLDDDNDVRYTLSVKNMPGVKLMNIHKSKGLEFPICYFSGLSVDFNKGDFKDSAGYFSESGIYYVPDGGTSIIKEVGAKKLFIKDISEKVRLLYVALTRTREKMNIIVEGILNAPSNYTRIKNMKDILSLAMEDLDPYIKYQTIDYVTAAYKNKINNKNINYNSKPTYVLNDYLGNFIEKNRISKEVIEVLSDEEQENLDYGNHLHEIMEAMDFTSPDLSMLDSEDYKIISKVLTNDLFKNIKNAKTYHEHEFYMTKDDKKYHGIIDLLVIYNDHIDIIDYKLKNINHPEYERQLKIYKDYIETKSNLKVNCYLLSLLNNESKKLMI